MYPLENPNVLFLFNFNSNVVTRNRKKMETFLSSFFFAYFIAEENDEQK